MDNNKFKVQSVVLPKDKFTLSEAKKKVMDLGYNHMRYHFMAEYLYDKNFKNPFIYKRNLICQITK